MGKHQINAFSVFLGLQLGGIRIKQLLIGCPMRFFRTSCAAQKKVFLARNALRILKHGTLFHIK